MCPETAHRQGHACCPPSAPRSHVSLRSPQCVLTDSGSVPLVGTATLFASRPCAAERLGSVLLFVGQARLLVAHSGVLWGTCPTSLSGWGRETGLGPSAPEPRAVREQLLPPHTVERASHSVGFSAVRLCWHSESFCSVQGVTSEGARLSARKLWLPPAGLQERRSLAGARQVTAWPRPLLQGGPAPCHSPFSAGWLWGGQGRGEGCRAPALTPSLSWTCSHTASSLSLLTPATPGHPRTAWPTPTWPVGSWRWLTPSCFSGTAHVSSPSPLSLAFPPDGCSEQVWADGPAEGQQCI